MALLERIREPADLRRLSAKQLERLAGEIRTFLIERVSRTGGHLGPNLGIVEVTLALHRVFDSPHDRIVFDTGHQAYVHKILTGRQAGFAKLRRRGGLSGYPNRAESPHDIVENSHASTALSYADGLAKAYQIRGERRHVVAVIGDGALTGGMAWEALNNIAAAKDRPLTIVVNDNGRSYSPTVGGLGHHLTTMRTNPRYEQVLELIKANLGRTPLVGPALYDVLHGMKKGLKDLLAPQGLFEDLGLKYIGPVDGHDEHAVEQALRQAKGFAGPVIVHCLTRKGFGYRPAEQDETDCLHSPGAFDIATGKAVGPSVRKWTAVFAEELRAVGADRPDVVAITAAMRHPTGLDPFARAFPDRFFDVGIAEAHAVTSAAGLAMGGLHPVVAVYSTFLNRAFDQVLMDVALHRCGVTFVLDRAGVTGDDGPSHNGMWDLSVLQVVPGLRIAAPRDEATLRAELREALAVDDAPTVLRIAKGEVTAPIPATDRVGGVDVLVRRGEPDVLLVPVGDLAGVGLQAGERLADHGVGVTVVDPRWVKPIDPALVELARGHRVVVTVEDNLRVGGFGSSLAQALRDADVDTPLRDLGIPQEFLRHAKRAEILADLGLTAQALTREIVGFVARHAGQVLEPPAALDGRPASAGRDGLALDGDGATGSARSAEQAASAAADRDR